MATEDLNGPGGPTHGIFLGFDIDHRGSIPELVHMVADRFKVQRMLSPPDTSLLLVSVIGDFDVSEFLTGWRREAPRDPVLVHFLGELQLASILHGTREGRALSEASLLIQPKRDE